MSYDNPFEDLRSLAPATISDKDTGILNLDSLQATQLQSSKDTAAAAARSLSKPQEVAFPSHLYTPAGAQSLDLRKLTTVPAATVRAEFFRFKSPPGVVTRFLGYGIYNDGALASNFSFEPLVDGNRVFPYHGDPSDGYRISLGLSPDLSVNSIIPCQLALMPEQEIVWYVTNNDAVAADMGVRMVGYFDTSQRITTPRFGG